MCINSCTVCRNRKIRQNRAANNKKLREEQKERAHQKRLLNAALEVNKFIAKQSDSFKDDLYNKVDEFHQKCARNPLVPFAVSGSGEPDNTEYLFRNSPMDQTLSLKEVHDLMFCRNFPQWCKDGKPCRVGN